MLAVLAAVHAAHTAPWWAGGAAIAAVFGLAVGIPAALLIPDRSPDDQSEMEGSANDR